MAFGKLVAFASREAVETFKRRYYRQTTQWNRPPKLTVQFDKSGQLTGRRWL